MSGKLASSGYRFEFSPIVNLKSGEQEAFIIKASAPGPQSGRALSRWCSGLIGAAAELRVMGVASDYPVLMPLPTAAILLQETRDILKRSGLNIVYHWCPESNEKPETLRETSLALSELRAQTGNAIGITVTAELSATIRLLAVDWLCIGNAMVAQAMREKASYMSILDTLSLINTDKAKVFVNWDASNHNRRAMIRAGIEHGAGWEWPRRHSRLREIKGMFLDTPWLGQIEAGEKSEP